MGNIPVLKPKEVDELTELKSALTRILTGGQSYAAEGRTLTPPRADLATLDRMIHRACRPARKSEPFRF